MYGVEKQNLYFLSSYDNVFRYTVKYPMHWRQQKDNLILSSNWAIGPMSCPITRHPSRGRYCCSMNGISCVMVCGTHHELNKIKYWGTFKEGMGWEKLWWGMFKPKHGFDSFWPFFGPDFTTYRMKMRQKQSAQSSKRQPERNKESYFKIVALKQWYSNWYGNGTNLKTRTVQ